jgi:serine/threonine-protein kinase
VAKLPEYIKDPADLRAAQISMAESMFANGDLDSAQRVFTQVIPAARAAGDINALAQAEADSGDIAYMQGQSELGAKLTADALELSRRPGVTASVRIWSEVYYAYNRENMGFRSDENVRMLKDAVEQSRKYNLPPQEAADVIDDQAQDLEVRGRLDEAEAAFRQALEVYGRDPLALCDQSGVLGELAHIDVMRGDPTSSLPLYKRSVEGYTACSGADSRGALDEQIYYADALMQLGRPQEALPLVEAAMPGWRKIAGGSPDLAEPLYFLARAYVQTGRYQDAEKTAKELVACQEGKVAPTDRRFGVSHMVWAEALAGERRWQEALPHAEIAEKLLANSISAGAKKTTAEAHRVLLDIQSNLH